MHVFIVNIQKIYNKITKHESYRFLIKKKHVERLKLKKDDYLDIFIHRIFRKEGNIVKYEKPLPMYEKIINVSNSLYVTLSPEIRDIIQPNRGDKLEISIQKVKSETSSES